MTLRPHHWLALSLLAVSAIWQAAGNAEVSIGNKAMRGPHISIQPGKVVAKALAELADINESAKLVPDQGAASDRMGNAVAASGNTVVVGAFNNDEGAAIDAGAAYVYVRDAGGNWTQQQRIVSPIPTSFDYFGHSVAISGDTLAIGAYFDDEGAAIDAGAVYVYTRAGGIWTLQQRVVADTPASSDRFGYSVALDGDTLAVGATLDDSAGGNNSGAAYVFTRTGSAWNQQQRLLAAAPLANSLLGSSIAVSGDRLVVGAASANTVLGAGAGAAYVFSRAVNVWTQQSLLIPGTGAANDNFGQSVDIDGTSLIVGQPNFDSVAGFNSGRASVYIEAGGVWSLQSTLTATDAAQDDFFGLAVSIAGNLAVVGAYFEDATAVNGGSAYVFRRDGVLWTQLDKYIASDAGIGDQFGFGVALSGGTAIIGAPYDDNTFGTDAGAAYIFLNGAPTTTDLMSSHDNRVYGQSLTLTATVTGENPTGQVTFFNGAANLGSADLFGGMAQLDLILNAGVYNITASYQGDADNLSSTSAASPVTVTQDSTSMILNSSDDNADYGETLTFTADISAPQGAAVTGSINFMEGAVILGSAQIIGGTAEFNINNLSVGAHNITAEYAGSLNHTGSSAGPIAQMITKATITIELTSSPNPSLEGNPITLTATLTGGLPTASVIFTRELPLPSAFIGVANIVGGVATINTLPLNSIGTYVFRASYAEDTNHFAAQDDSPDHLVIPAADLSITKINDVTGNALVQNGLPTTYTITVHNNGPADVTGALVNDLIDNDLFDEATSVWSCSGDGISSCAIGNGNGSIIDLSIDLPNGTEVTIELTTPVRLESVLGVSNTATVTLPDGIGDPIPSNNSATDTDGSGMFLDGFEN